MVVTQSLDKKTTLPFCMHVVQAGKGYFNQHLSASSTVESATAKHHGHLSCIVDVMGCIC